MFLCITLRILVWSEWPCAIQAREIHNMLRLFRTQSVSIYLLFSEPGR